MSHFKLLQNFKTVVMSSRLVCDVFGVWHFHHRAGPQTVNTLVYLIERLLMCVCVCLRLHVCVCLLMRQSFDVQPVPLLFFVVIRQIPLLFLSPTMHCCLYQGAQEVEKCWDVKTSPYLPPLAYLFSFFPPLCISLPSTPLLCFNL